MTMTLKEVRDEMRALCYSEHVVVPRQDCMEWLAALDAHLSQPAQAADVTDEMVDRAFARFYAPLPADRSDPAWSDMRAALTRAISTAQADGWRVENDASVAAIEFALHAEDGLLFLRYWNEGAFDVCRNEWPEAPATCYAGADPLLPAHPAPDKEGKA